MDTRELTHQEWLKEAVEKFGKDPNKWRFVCPSCGHVQTRQDFLDTGLPAKQVDNILAYSCIGRWRQGPGRDVKHLGEKDTGDGCNYAGGGLFNLNPVGVKLEAGDARATFEFDAQDTNS